MLLALGCLQEIHAANVGDVNVETVNVEASVVLRVAKDAACS